MNNEEFVSKRKIFKFNEDDILEILSEYLAEESGFDTYQSKVVLIGEPNKDLRMIAIIGELDDDDIEKLDIDKIDIELEYNDSH